MREIKFRRWNGEGMFYGGFSIHATGGVANDFSFLKEGAVMQYTGLKDKKGVEIYEGDILVPSDLSGSGQLRTFRNRTVSWDDEMCEFNVSSGNHRYEVIGNIYENGDLINN